MVRVIDIWDEAQEIIGNMADDFAFKRITDAVELLAQKGDFDPQIGKMDIRTTCGRVVTLPPDIETILSAAVCGFPSVARDELFQFHINGPGEAWGKQGEFSWGVEGIEIQYEWMDLHNFPTYCDITTPDSLLAYCTAPQDVNCQFWVYGLDQNGNEVMSINASGQPVRGYRVPVFQSVAAIPANSQTFSHISWVQKPLTAGPIKLSTVGGIALGVYQPTETVPQFRRIKVSRHVPWVRILYRRKTLNVVSKYDVIPVANKQAVLMMLRALKAYGKPDTFAEAEQYEATAVRWLSEKQERSNPPVVSPIQVLGSAPLLEPWDFMD